MMFGLCGRKNIGRTVEKIYVPEEQVLKDIEGEEFFTTFDHYLTDPGKVVYQVFFSFMLNSL